MSRRNLNGSSAKKRRKRVHDWRPARAPAVGASFWSGLRRLGEATGKRLGDLIHGRLELYLKTYPGERLLLAPGDQSWMTRYGMATRKFRMTKDALIISEEIATAPVTYETLLLDYPLKEKP